MALKTETAAKGIAANVARIQARYIASGRVKLARGERLNVCERTYLRQVGEVA